MKKADMPVLGMSCAGCAARIEKELKGHDGIVDANINFASGVLSVIYDEKKLSPASIKEIVGSAGYDLIIDEEPGGRTEEEARSGHYRQLRRRTIAAWVLAVPLMAVAMSLMHGGNLMTNLVQMLLALAIMLFCGRGFYINAWKQALKGTANMDTLVALSTAIAFLFSLFNTFFPGFWTQRGVQPHVYYEAAGAIVAFVLLGKLLEERAKSNTSSAIRRLMGLQPETAHLLSAGAEKEVPVSTLVEGDRLSVKPGERIPVDGNVLEGESYVDESMISGEPLAVRKQAGSRVLAGTINQKGGFVMEAAEVGETTVLARIVSMVRQAQGSKAPVQRLADRISAIFVPVILVLSVVTFAVWMIWGGENAFSYGLLSAVSVLVIACPCALGLATPTALMVGIGKGAEEHILIKDASALENMCRVDTMVMDKTGTLTSGAPAVAGMEWSVPEDGRLLALLYGAERRSEHPLADAVCRWLEESGVRPADVDFFGSVTGEGITFSAQGEEYWVGSGRMASDRGVPQDSLRSDAVSGWQKSGQSVIFYGQGNKLLLLICIVDPLKPGAAGAVARLQGLGIKVHLLSGDNADTARVVAGSLGIEDVKAGAMPQDKEDYIAALQAEGHVVAMVGDGINDSQALARADVSVAMGRGTDIAMEVAMVTLMNSDPGLLPQAVTLSRETVRTIRQNLFWAFIYNVIAIPLAAGALYPVWGLLLDPMWASAAMAFSSVSVVLNSLRLKLK